MSRLTVAPLAQFDASGGAVIITAPYGDGRGHQGVDWGTTDGIEIGTTLYAPVDGWIENTGDDGPWSPAGHTAGRWLWFRGTNGTRWKMFHLHAITAPTGVTVAAGTPIAEVGNTGTQAAHLHLEEHAQAWNLPIDMTADCHEVINAGRWPGQPLKDWFDMATEADLRRVVADEINKALGNNYTGGRALKLESADEVFELVTINGERWRRYLGTTEEINTLQYVDQLAGKPGQTARVVSDPTMESVLASLPWTNLSA